MKRNILSAFIAIIGMTPIVFSQYKCFALAIYINIFALVWVVEYLYKKENNHD